MSSSMEASQEPFGITLASWRPPDRRSWSRLGRSSSRIREGELELKWIAKAPDGLQHMAVRLKRKVGSAPLRNRVRRVLRELHREKAAEIGAVWMLWSLPSGKLHMPTRAIRPLAEGILVKAGLLGANRAQG